MIKVVLADDHRLIREALKNIIQNNREVSIIGEAADGEEAYRMVLRLQPDILISDISMPGLNGIELTRKLSAENNCTKVLILSMHVDEEFISKSMEAGAWGYLFKNLRPEEITEAICGVYNGEKYYSQSASQLIYESYFQKLQRKRQEVREPDPELTERELEILQLVADGHSNKEIAVKLMISVRTVDAHRYRILQKMKVRNSAELIHLAMKNGMIK